MAFFELIHDWWELISTDARKKLKLVGGRGTGGFYPAPDCYVEGAANYGANPVQFDSVGNLMARSAVFTDEKSLRDDFPGTSQAVALTGTVSFTADSDEVTGVGTEFLSELNNAKYIKLGTAADTSLRKVLDVLSDTLLELEEVYPTTESGTATSQHFLPIRSAGLSVASSKISIVSGTTSGESTGIYIPIDFGPLMAVGYIDISARVADQEFKFGFLDDELAAEQQAIVVFDGTDNTKCKFRTSSSSAAADIEETTVTLPGGYLTTASLAYQVSMTPKACFLTIGGQRCAVHEKHVPGPYDVVKICAKWKNTATAVSSTANVDSIYISNHNRIDISATFTGDQIPVRTEEEVHVLMGVLTTTAVTADQVICSATVPTGKQLYVIGYTMSSNSANVDGSPVKIGKGTVTTEPAAPGVVDGNIMTAHYLKDASTFALQMNSPVLLASSGETVKMTVTPSDNASTIWRGTIYYVLR